MKTVVAFHATHFGFSDGITAQGTIVRWWVNLAWWRSYSKLMRGK